MKKIVFVVISCSFFSFAFSQDTSGLKLNNIKKNSLLSRPGDHLLIQLSSDHWAGMTDSIKSHQKGLSRGFSAYFMLDKPFKSSPKYSIGFGVGISTSNIFFKKESIDLTSSTSTILPFIPLDSSNHFKRYKLTTAFLEVPLEIRYSSKPSEPNKGFKAALGLKLGALVNAHTKGKTLDDKNSSLINSYTLKENSKRFIDGSRFTATARVGYGVISLFGTFQLNNVLKAGAGPTMNLYQIGITLSGL
jgi:hypothetical protein